MKKPDDVGNVITTTGEPTVHFYTGFGDDHAYIHVYDTDIWVRIEDMEKFALATDTVFKQICGSSHAWDVVA